MTLNRAYAPISSHPDSEDLFGIKSRDERNDGWMSGLMSNFNKKKERKKNAGDMNTESVLENKTSRLL